ncbi:DHHA1 domain-containing protein [Mesorhizobium sp.]|uniref:DHHA1 domain-containing protein n=1 Tax=Mesorhizobium sp. TaxID=1871066 RepID=UPI0012176135|nr:DHHA1 domain-containing protein [Mesorhizobium sp.]TIO72203.1 MAG: phosphohydrolase [Mesorhizobium sp.]
MTWKPDLCIYHGGCGDGFGAAWAIWKRWGNEVAYIPGYYGKPLPDATGRHVLFVDFSAKRPELVAMADRAKSIVILDHHKTAEADLADWNGPMPALTDIELLAAKACTETGSPIVAVFDMNQSGATLAWQFATETNRHDDPCPEMLTLIEDRDLWRFAFGDRTRRFSAALRTYPMEFAVWDELAGSTGVLIADGKAILRAHQANIGRILQETYFSEIGGFTVPTVNAPYHYASDAAHEMLSRYPTAPFTACWFRRADGQIQYSLRSEDSRIDVSEIAKSFGGGGHRNAAGFQVPMSNWRAING